MTAAPNLALIPSSEWISSDEATRRTGWTDRWLRAKAANGEIVSRASKSTSANGRPQREYLASSLVQASTIKTPVVRLAPVEPLFATLPSPDRVALPNPEEQKQAEERLELIQPLLDFARNPRLFENHTLPGGRKITSETRLIELITSKHDVSAPTLKRWKQRFREGGFAALADRVRCDKGQSRWFAQNRKAAMLAAYLYLDQRQSVSFVVEEIVRQAELLGIGRVDAPSYETVRVFLSQEISPAMTTLAREGRRAYQERMAPYVRRGFTDVFANQVWVGDHMIHDVEVANDLFDEAPLGAPVRLRLSAMLDYRSRKLVGASWAWEGSSRAIAATMRRGILQFGPPEHIYVDNGKDYRKVARGAMRGSELTRLDESEKAPAGWWRNEWTSIERTGFLARLGIAVTHCIAHHPQSKHVERFFRTLHERFDAVHATYTSGSPFTRPDATEARMMRHRRLLKAGDTSSSDHPLASRFILGCLSWIEEYNETPHRGEGMDGRTPNEVFHAEQNPDQRPSPEPAALALLMADRECRQVHECAVVIRKQRYTPRAEDRMAWAAMHERNERDVLVAFDSEDPSCAAALDLDGHFIAWLEAETLLRFAPGDERTRQQIGESMEIRRGLEKATRKSIALIASEARVNGARSAEEMLYDRLQLPAAAGGVITQRKPRLRADKSASAPQTAADLASNILEALK